MPIISNIAYKSMLVAKYLSQAEFKYLVGLVGRGEKSKRFLFSFSFIIFIIILCKHNGLS
jgi:hypothetical protein